MDFLKKLLGRGKPNSTKRMMGKLRVTKATNESKLEDLKDQIRDLTERAREKKREYDAETARHLKRIIAGEINRLLDQLDRFKNREIIIERNLNQTILLIEKNQELESAELRGVSEEDMDELAIDLEDVFADMKDTDRAVKELEKVAYQPERAKETNIEERMAELELDGQPEAGGKETDEDLVEETQLRLKELDLDT